MKPPLDRAAAQMVIVRARSRAVWVPAMTAREVGKRAAAPRPAMTWPIQSWWTPCGYGGDELAQDEEGRAADQQALAAEEVTEDAEGQLKDGDGEQEGVRDPGELRTDGVQVLLEEAVEGGRHREGDLGQADGEAARDEGAERQAAARCRRRLVPCPC